MKDLSTFQHFVGCDVSKDTLDFAIHKRGVDCRSFRHTRVSNSPEGFQTVRKWLRGFKINIRDAVIAMEHTGFYSEALARWCDSKKITFVLLHPLDVKNACGRGRNKTDEADAQFIADYAYTMREKLSPSHPEAPVIRQLRQLQSERGMAVKTRTAFINMSKSLTDSASAKRVQGMIDALTAQIKAIEAAMKKAVMSVPEVNDNYELLVSIPGIGLVNAVATIVATGNFTRFQNARQYAKFSCVSPLRRESGTSVRGGDHVSKAGHSEIKALLTEGARSAVRHDPQMKAYYARKRAEGKSHGCVMNAVKFKLICRMFAVIGRKTQYVDVDNYRRTTPKTHRSGNAPRQGAGPPVPTSGYLLPSAEKSFVKNKNAVN